MLAFICVLKLFVIIIIIIISQVLKVLSLCFLLPVLTVTHSSVKIHAHC